MKFTLKGYVMSDDQLEAEALEPVEVEQVEAQTDQSSETVSDSGEDHEKKPTFSPEQRAAADQAYKAREAAREAKELRKQLEELQSKQSVETKPTVPVLSEFPDEDEIAAYTEAVRKEAAYNVRQTLAEEQQQETDFRAKQESQTKQVAKEQTYIENAKKSGVDTEDLSTAVNIVGSYGLGPELADAIMGDEDGALITMHLSTNLSDLQALKSATNLIELGQVYASIKSKAVNLKPKQTETPPPADILNGNAAVNQKHPALEGVIYS